MVLQTHLKTKLSSDRSFVAHVPVSFRVMIEFFEKKVSNYYGADETKVTQFVPLALSETSPTYTEQFLNSSKKLIVGERREKFWVTSYHLFDDFLQ